VATSVYSYPDFSNHYFESSRQTVGQDFTWTMTASFPVILNSIHICKSHYTKHYTI